MSECFEMGEVDGLAMARVTLGLGKVLVAYAKDLDGNHGIVLREIAEAIPVGGSVTPGAAPPGKCELFLKCNAPDSAAVLLRAVLKLNAQLNEGKGVQEAP